MKGDFSRITFDRFKHYAGVLHQQGRVWLDSDWNEDVFERLDQLQQETYDIVGRCGVPVPGTAFQITPGPDPAHPENFAIGGGPGPAGRAYVEGLLCKMDSPCTYFTQPDLLDSPPIQFPQDGSDHFGLIYLEVWRRLITYLEDPSIAEIALGGPDTATRIKTIAQVKALLVPNGTTCSDLYSYLPSGDATLTTVQPIATQPTDLCSLPDPANYTGRENHNYRVEIHTGGGAIDPNGASALTFAVLLAQDAPTGSIALTLSAVLTSQQIASIDRWGGVLTLNDADGRAEQISIATVPASGSVLVLSSPLANAFTVAKHAAVLGLAQFKWSRDNAANAVSVVSVSADRQTLTLASLGRDQASALHQGDIVEVSDDASELGRSRGHLTTITGDPDPDMLTVTIGDPLPASFRLSSDPNPPESDRHLVLRRWDGRGVARTAYDDSATPDMNLGNGVHIKFGGADLRPGDYWNIVARSADGSVEALIKAPPKGILRYYCPLALVKWTPMPVGSPPASPPILSYVMNLVQDCRRIFSPLTDIPGADQGMRIIGLFSINANTGGKAPLLNDRAVTVSSLLGGIDVVCDRNVDPNSVSRPTFFITLEIPFTAVGQTVATPVVAYQTLSLVGIITTRGRVISWRFDPNAAKVLPQIAALKSQLDRGVLCRLTLKGDFIWSATNPRLFLDGDSFADENSAGNTSITLPSGDRRRGGDFETWFWLVVDPTAKAKEKEKEKELEKVSEKLTDKVAEVIKTTDKVAEKSKEAEKPREKVKDKDKVRDKVTEKTREKIQEKVRDKIKDRELAPSLGTLSTSLGNGALQQTSAIEDAQSPRRHFIVAEERPDVGRKLLDDGIGSRRK